MNVSSPESVGAGFADGVKVRISLAAALAAAAALTACSDGAELTLADKARFTAELIDNRRECAVYVERLAPPVSEAAVVAETYRAAKAAHCLKPDV